jgi:hypothetical protein
MSTAAVTEAFRRIIFTDLEQRGVSNCAAPSEPRETTRNP